MNFFLDIQILVQIFCSEAVFYFLLILLFLIFFFFSILQIFNHLFHFNYTNKTKILHFILREGRRAVFYLLKIYSNFHEIRRKFVVNQLNLKMQRMRKIPLIGKNRAFSYKIRNLCLKVYIYLCSGKKSKIGN